LSSLLHITMCLDIIYPCKNSQAIKTGVAFKNLGEKSFEIKGGSQEMAANILRFISVNS